MDTRKSNWFWALLAYIGLLTAITLPLATFGSTRLEIDESGSLFSISRRWWGLSETRKELVLQGGSWHYRSSGDPVEFDVGFPDER